MKIKKIIEIIAPKTDREHPWDCFDIMIDCEGKIIKCCMNRLSYKVFIAEQELLKQGVNPDLLGEYKDAVREEAEYDACE